MKTVKDILSVHRKTIKALITRKTQIEKQETMLQKQVVNINKVLEEAGNEKKQAEIATSYLSGLFEAIGEDVK